MDGNGASANGKGKPSKLKNHVAIILDESGSMGPMRREVIDAFNQQVSDIREKAKDQETTVSLVKFNTIVPVPVYWLEPVERLRLIGPDDYMPNGMTAMLDAVGSTIDRLKTLPDAEDEDTSFLVLVISDGIENNSKRYSSAAVAERIQALDKTDRWTFTYLGANQDLSRVAHELKIPKANTESFVADAAGYSTSSEHVRMSQGRFFEERRKGKKSVKDFYQNDPPAGPDVDCDF